MSAPASSAPAPAAAASAASAAKPGGKGPKLPKAEVVVPESAATAAGIEAIRESLCVVLGTHAVAELAYKPKPAYTGKDGAQVQPPTKLARSYETPEKACIAFACPVLSDSQFAELEFLVSTRVGAAYRPFRFVKPARAKGTVDEAEGYEFTFVVGETAKKLEAKTAKEKLAVESKKVGGGASAAIAAASAAAASGAVAPAAASAPAGASSAASAVSSQSASASAFPSASPLSSAFASPRPSTSQELYELALVSFARLQLSSLPLESMLERVAPMVSAKYLSDLRKRLDTTPQFQALEVSRLLNDLSGSDLLASLPEAHRAFLKRDLFDASFDNSVRMVENEAYTRGMEAARRGNGGINIAKLL